MSIAINNNSYDFSMINVKGVDIEAISSVNSAVEGKSAQKVNQIGKVECQTFRDRKYKDLSNGSKGNARTVTKLNNNDEKKDYFITNYNDVVAKNFGLIFDTRI